MMWWQIGHVPHAELAGGCFRARAGVGEGVGVELWRAGLAGDWEEQLLGLPAQLHIGCNEKSFNFEQQNCGSEIISLQSMLTVCGRWRRAQLCGTELGSLEYLSS
jgi:hypothetical protein